VSLLAGPSALTYHVGVIESTHDGVVITVRVIPRASRSGVSGTRDGALLVRLHAPPVEGAANEELVAVMANALQVPKRAVSIASGERSRSKRVHVRGIDGITAEARLSNRRA
jgi:uncharacterized protein